MINTPKYHKRYILPGKYIILQFFSFIKCYILNANLNTPPPPLFFPCQFFSIMGILNLDAYNSWNSYQLGRPWVAPTVQNQNTRAAAWMMKMTGINLGMVGSFTSWSVSFHIYWATLLHNLILSCNLIDFPKLFEPQLEKPHHLQSGIY